MEQIALIFDHIYVYWSDVVRLLAVCAGVCAFLALYLKKEKRGLSAVIFVPLALVLSLYLSRLAHRYFRPDSYETMEAVLHPLLPGGYALAGAFAGCILAGVLLRLVRLTQDLPELLDCVSIGGSLGIALGRLAPFFNSSDRGKILTTNVGLPWVITGINPVSGETECRIAVFLLQAIACGLIFLVLLLFYRTAKRRAGDTALLFLLFYGASQVILDSLRYDSLYFRSNGFVSVAQVLGAAAIALAVIVFGVRLVRAGGWKKWYFGLWLFQAACFGLAGYMEYHVQRHGSEALFAYSIMGAALAGLLLSALVTRHLAAAEEKKHAQWLLQITEHQMEVSP